MRRIINTLTRALRYGFTSHNNTIPLARIITNPEALAIYKQQVTEARENLYRGKHEINFMLLLALANISTLVMPCDATLAPALMLFNLYPSFSWVADQQKLLNNKTFLEQALAEGMLAGKLNEFGLTQDDYNEEKPIYFIEEGDEIRRIEEITDNKELLTVKPRTPKTLLLPSITFSARLGMSMGLSNTLLMIACGEQSLTIPSVILPSLLSCYYLLATLPMNQLFRKNQQRLNTIAETKKQQATKFSDCLKLVMFGSNGLRGKESECRCSNSNIFSK